MNGRAASAASGRNKKSEKEANPTITHTKSQPPPPTRQRLSGRPLSMPARACHDTITPASPRPFPFSPPPSRFVNTQRAALSPKPFFSLSLSHPSPPLPSFSINHTASAWLAPARGDAGGAAPRSRAGGSGRAPVTTSGGAGTAATAATPAAEAAAAAAWGAGQQPPASPHVCPASARATAAATEPGSGTWAPGAKGAGPGTAGGLATPALCPDPAPEVAGEGEGDAGRAGAVVVAGGAG